MHVVSLAERPELADAAFGIPYGPTGGTFMQGSLSSLLVRRRRLGQRWPEHVLVLLHGDVPVARGACHSPPTAMSASRAPTVAGIRSRSGPPKTPWTRGRRTRSLVAPVRPPDKAADPTSPLPDYLARVRLDGLPLDRWLRVHVRAGGHIVGVARCSATVQAPLSQWRRWTGLPFDKDGPTVVPGGLVPVLVSTTHDIGVYVEPNVWVRHAFA